MTAGNTCASGVPGDLGEHGLRQIGQELRDARLARGDDLRDIAAYLRIRVDYLAALEDGDLVRMPGRPYALGFLRSYADYLALNGELLVTRLKSGLRGRIAAPAPAAPGRHAAWELGTGATVLAVLLLFGSLWAGYRSAAPQLDGSAGLVAPPPLSAVVSLVATEPAAGSTVPWPDPGQAVGAEQAPLAMLVSAESEDAPVRPESVAGEGRPVSPAPSGRAP